jgi:hypothetical protein
MAKITVEGEKPQKKPIHHTPWLLIITVPQKVSKARKNRPGFEAIYQLFGHSEL